MTVDDKSQILSHVKAHLKNHFGLSADQIDIMLPSFIEAVTDHWNSLHQAQDEGQLDQINRAAHTLKGALLNLGLNEIAAKAYEMEIYAYPDIEGCKKILSEIDVKLNLLIT